MKFQLFVDNKLVNLNVRRVDINEEGLTISYDKVNGVQPILTKGTVLEIIQQEEVRPYPARNPNIAGVHIVAYVESFVAEYILCKLEQEAQPSE